jgi:hypothetical protein
MPVSNLDQEAQLGGDLADVLPLPAAYDHLYDHLSVHDPIGWRAPAVRESNCASPSAR